MGRVGGVRRGQGQTSHYRALHGRRSLDVVYDPRNPNRLQAADWGFDYRLPGLALVGGALFTGLTVHTGRHGFPDWLRRD